MSDQRAAFEDFLTRAESAVAERDGVVGLVGMGSTAERDRVDEWSDHDLALIARDGRQDEFRPAATWLPDPERIAVEVREHHGGGKVVYDDGHVVEYGVASLGELEGWAANAYDVRIDRGGVAETMATLAARPAPVPPDPDRDLGLVLALALIGVGRARRGERLSASTLVRGAAVEALTRAVAARVAPEHGARLDSLDPTRRFDSAYPSVAARIEALLASPVEPCARGLVELAVEIFGVGDAGVPSRGLTAVQRRLGWAPVGTIA
ncbi:hypothetical protein ACFPER_03250 [Agromyces aurantiacus]|uniref:Nucleotidyltransferase domain-containing protein n=1 Tax=Agromyces aurantiacus TaxID=165814 RepID=A0ABV9R2H0_9MICO|nr:hypothetical protein [Agromyces aurantiacus]MBM7506109.1 hypothetical protein [Agromyces aurantiacus]